MTICSELQQQEVIVTSPIPATITFERILIPTDFSDASQRALEYAESIARQYGSHLLLAHVNEPVNLITLPEDVWTDQRRVQEQIEQQLDQMGAELRSNGFQAETVSVTGLVASELLSLATKESADLIVVGTHGRSGVDRFLLGSEAELFRSRLNLHFLCINSLLYLSSFSSIRHILSFSIALFRGLSENQPKARWNNMLPFTMALIGFINPTCRSVYGR